MRGKSLSFEVLSLVCLFILNRFIGTFSSVGGGGGFGGQGDDVKHKPHLVKWVVVCRLQRRGGSFWVSKEVTLAKATEDLKNFEDPTQKDLEASKSVKKNPYEGRRAYTFEVTTP